MGFNHATVLLNETVDLLNVKPGGLYIDYTLGGGGHTSLILERGGTVVGIDRDDLAIENAKERFLIKEPSLCQVFPASEYRYGISSYLSLFTFFSAS